MIHNRVALVAVFTCLAVLAAPAQAPTGAVVRDLFESYEYYEDVPATPAGLSTILRLSPTELEYVRSRMRAAGSAGFVMLARDDPDHWMGLEQRGGAQLVRVRDAANLYNGRLAVDMSTGALSVLRGVNYKPLNPTEDAAVTAHLALGYLRRVMAGTDAFPPTLTLPGTDLAALGLSLPALTGTPSGGASPQAGAATGLGYRVPEGYLRLWSTAGVAAQELFAADKFGNDSALDAGDFAQAHLRWVDGQGEHLYQANDLEILILGRVRAPENPLRPDELEGMLARMAAASGGLDLTIDSIRTSLYVPSVAPQPQVSGSPSGAKSPALLTFEYLQALGLLAGDYTVVPEIAQTSVGLSQADLDLYWWARLQRAGTPAALYPPRIDSGGKLGWGDFALFAAVGLKRAGIPSMIVVIRRPAGSAVPYHAVCLYQVGSSWRWMDSGRFGDQTSGEWQRLPALIYGRDVVFRIVDVARDWLQPGVDESTGWLTSRISG